MAGRISTWAAIAVLFSGATLAGQEPDLGKPTGKHAWTLTSVLDALERSPDDSHLQYVAFHLAQAAKAEVRVEAMKRIVGPPAGRPRRRPDALSVFSGATAVQESLQLDTLRGEFGVKDLDANAIDPDAPPDVPELKQLLGQQPPPPDKLLGPTAKSHPWKKMLGDKTPAVSRLSRSVPEEFYLAEFRSPSKLLDLADQGQDWMRYLFGQADLDASESHVATRIKRQLLLDTTPALRKVYDVAVGAIAVTGSDLYLREGSDVTVLFELKAPALFQAHLTAKVAAARRTPGDWTWALGTRAGVEIRTLASSDGEVRVYSADPKPDLHVRSTSLVALERVLDVVAGKAPSLGASDEFRYVRTLMPTGAPEEDAFVYLSDPFVRNLIGPRGKLVERRRMVGNNHLRMIAHGAQMHLTQFGSRAKSLDELIRAGCLPPSFGKGRLASPFGGQYSLATDGLTGVCSKLGRSRLLTPGIELPYAKPSEEEAALYHLFVTEYNRYWTNWFDPIAVRVRITPDKVRAETIVLPLIDNSIYSAMATFLGGKTTALDALPVPKKNLMSLTTRWNKEAAIELLEREMTGHRMLQALNAAVLVGDPVHGFFAAADRASALPYFPRFAIEDDDDEEGEPRKRRPRIVALPAVPLRESDTPINYVRRQADPFDDLHGHRYAPAFIDFMTRGIGDQVGIHLYDQRIMFDIKTTQFLGEMLRPRGGFATGGDFWPGALEVGAGVFVVSSFFTPLYVSANVENPEVVDRMLEAFDDIVAENRRLLSGRRANFLRYSTDTYKFRTKQGNLVRAYCFDVDPLRWRVYLARIGNGLYLTNQTEVIDDLHAAHKAPHADRGPVGHGMLRLRPKNWNAALPGYQLGWAENDRQACCRNLERLGLAARAHEPHLTGTPTERAQALVALVRQAHDVDCRCPDGGVYSIEPDGHIIRCSVHGVLRDPIQNEAPATESPGARLMREFQDLSASFAFLPDGLRAVIEVERKRK